ncbi:ATP-dependent DNA helicase RecG [Bacteroidia bacterium]|nr:ATP-dependent DNA helicase RecG [Bacteroidia bacterium]
MTASLDTDIKFLAGVGPKRAEVLGKELNINTFYDLLYYFPFRYVDKSRIYTVRELRGFEGDLPLLQVKGKIHSMRVVPGKVRRLTAIFQDETGSMDLVWFKGISYIQKSIKPNTTYILFKEPTIFNGRFQMAHPDIEEAAQQEQNKIKSNIQAIYSSTEVLKNNYFSNKAISKMMSALLSAVLPTLAETLPPHLVASQKLLGIQAALLNIHFPQSAQLLQQAQHRLKWEELFYVELRLLRQRAKRVTESKGFVLAAPDNEVKTFYHHHLPFQLTAAQTRVLQEIRRDMRSSKQMNRLLQGDVGSGKTIVALLCSLIAADNKFQACLMAPTEILATQHYHGIASLLGDMNFKVALLTGSTKKQNRIALSEQLQNGEIQLLIGTHAIIEDNVQFANLGLVIIDEQHRFGVAQRSRLWSKNAQPPHVLVMTATPIPRTLAMTLYGDLDISVIDQLPPGRKPIRTVHYTDTQRGKVYNFLEEQIRQGRQAYIVYPLIQESEKMDYENLQEGYQMVCKRYPHYKIAMVHGQMKPAQKEQQMQLFVQNQAQILVATSVIEVGVNVPNASVMLIESSERFGLSAMHQLRGRVGRGADQSYCVLLSGVQLSATTRQRLQIMCSTNNGFEIADADLRLRGYGDLDGTKQSGISLNLKIAHLGEDAHLLEASRNVAEQILEEDRFLANEKNKILLQQLGTIEKRRVDYSVIS